MFDEAIGLEEKWMLPQALKRIIDAS